MLQITVPELELWDEQREEFIKLNEQILNLEHSLVSISKWESKWHKAFLGKKDRTTEEIIDYVRCMTLNKNVSDDVYYRLTEKNLDEINEYINNPMTAVHFPEDKTKGKGSSKEVVTNEVIYYWMISFNIPVEFEKWHINHLLTLIQVCEIKNNPKSKRMSKKEIMNRNRALNEARRKQFNTKG